MKHGPEWLALAGGFALVASANAQGSNPGEVLYEGFVSALQGGLSGIGAGDLFGDALTPLGDMDGDGIPDVVVGAPLDDDGGSDRGAAYVLFLARDGNVKAQQKISDLVGGFSGVLDDSDFFGGALATLGDLDGDDVVDLAVSAINDDDGGTDRGAVWILFMNADGTVKGHQKISDLAGGFTGVIDDGDNFGVQTEAVADLNGDGRAELAVGARRDDDGGTDRGAVWILFLNSDGTVASHAKISSTTGGLTGPLADGDNFGIGIASLGDLDGGGSSVGALAVGAPIASPAGTMWVLFLNASGNVLSEQRIAEGVGGFTGDLDVGDQFGQDIENLVDVGAPGSLDIAVGAFLDDDGGLNVGAIWILSLNSSGAAVYEQKISATEGNFAPIAAGDGLGLGLASIGDLDLDGRNDLVAGVRGEDDGGTDTGALWELWLNDGTLPLGLDTEWIGTIDRDWAKPGNWSNGVPDSTKDAFIHGQPNTPLVSSAQACKTLLHVTAGLLEVNSTLSVHGGALVNGTVPGTGEVRFEAAGNLSGRGSVSVKTVFNQDMTVQGGPLTIADDLDVREDLTIEADGELVVSGTADLDPTTSAVLSGAGTLDLNGTVDLQMADGTSVPRLELAGSVTIDSSVFSPATGTTRFDGAAAQAVTQLSGSPTQFFDVEVDAAADVTAGGDMSVNGDLLLDGDLSVVSDFDLDGDLLGGSSSNLSAGCMMSFGGNFEHHGGLSSSCMIVITEPSSAALVMDVTNPFPSDLEIQIGGRMDLLSALTVQGDLHVVDGVFAAGVDTTIDVDALELEAGASFETEGFLVSLPGAPPLTVRGELAVEPGGRLELSASPVAIESGGTLRVVNGIVRGFSGGGYALTVGAGATLAANGFVFRDMGTGGVVIHRDALLAPAPLDLRSGLFSRAASGGILLRIDRAAPTTLRFLRFEDPLASASKNVRVGMTSAPITLLHWTGKYAGPAFEDDPLGEPGLFDWGTSKLRPPAPDPSSPLLGGGSSQPPAPGPVRGGGNALARAVSDLGAGVVAELVVEAGLYSSFRLDGGSGRAIRLVAQGNARIDTRRGPLEIHGLGPDEVLELAGFELGGAAAGPVLLVGDSRGALRLAQCRIEGEILLSSASTVILEECAGESLVLERASRAQVRGGGLATVELAGRSRLESFGLATSARIAPDSRWIDHGGAWPRLELVQGTLRLDPAAVGAGWLVSSGALDLAGTKHGWALRERGLEWLGSLGAGETRPIPPSDSRPRFYQVLVYDSARRAFTTSNLVSRF